MKGRLFALASVAVLAVGAWGCVPVAQTAPAQTYTPQTRQLTVTALPMLVTENEGTYDWLAEDFAPGGVLAGKEVYSFDPSTLTVYAGDTVDLTIVNPENDAHTFTINALGVNVAFGGQSTTQTSFVASTPGIYQFYCAVPEHIPFMWGQLVVLRGGDA